MPNVSRLLPLLLSILTVFGAEQISQESLKEAAGAYFDHRPQTQFPPGIPYAEALAIQGRYVQLLVPRVGPRVGYKAGLVTPAGQQRFALNHPVRGVLLEKMLLPDGSRVPAKYGTLPILEADLIVRVKDEGLNDSDNVKKAAQHLSEVIAFIELADGTLATNAPPDGGKLVASNVGARLGIIGEARHFESSDEFIDAFGRMKIVLKKNGKEVSRVSAEGILGHPLNAVLWLVKDMKAKGETLRAGEVLSLGSPSPQVSPRPGEEYSLIYEGLPGGDLHATVHLE